ncbi:MAG TPA: NAD(P)-dependent oxidoreductase [Rhodothermales bacterium]|nr:NAD(P)-dependent oxidoreductase [Rhodothermales bacterium]
MRERVGWIGTGRMGSALVGRLLRENVDVAVYNRTRSKAEALTEMGATVVDSPADLAELDVVFLMVAGPEDVLEVVSGKGGLLTRPGVRPAVIVDSTTIDVSTSLELRRRAGQRGASVVAAPVSGNPDVVKAGKLTVVASGPAEAFEIARPFLETFGREVTYIGALDEARLVKICHNLMLGVVTQCMAEITVLVSAAGVSRADFLDFLNDSVMGSVFTRYKSPAFVTLDYTPTYTWHLLRKDFELGLEMAAARGVPMPSAALVHSILSEGIDGGFGDEDFASMLTLQARASRVELVPEDRVVASGL